MIIRSNKTICIGQYCDVIRVILKLMGAEIFPGISHDPLNLTFFFLFNSLAVWQYLLDISDIILFKVDNKWQIVSNFECNSS